MHLLDILALRSRPGAGVYLSVTQRCPLSCAHCSTSSNMRGVQIDEDPYLRFVASMHSNEPPTIIFITGGEPLIRPGLVSRITDLAHANGSSVVVLTGAFFVRHEPTPPAQITATIEQLDHIMVSLDAFHEREVPRRNMLLLLQRCLDYGLDVSVQLTGMDAADPYLVDAIHDIRDYTEDRVPIFVGLVSPMGRARDLPLSQSSASMTAGIVPLQAPRMTDPWPCPYLAWPVFTWDGVVTACCNQDVVTGPAPAHLTLADRKSPRWAQVRDRTLTNPLLRAIRTYGPKYVAARFTPDETQAFDDYCTACSRLADTCKTDKQDAITVHMVRRESQAVEAVVRALQADLHRYTAPGFEELLGLGQPQHADGLKVTRG